MYAKLGALARFPGGVEVVFDYGNPPDTIEEESRRMWLTWRTTSNTAT